MALGLVSFATLAIFGLLPGGLATLSESANQTIEAQIVRAVAARSLVTPFDELGGATLFFDASGVATPDAEAAVFTATVTTNAPVFPGSTNSPTAHAHLTTVRVAVVRNPGSSPGARTNHFTLAVANAGK